jgi:cell division protein FtsW
LQFQPSEIAKIVVVLSLAAWYAHFQTEGRTFWKGFVFPCLLLGVPVLLIFFEKDMGTSMSLGLAGVLVMFVAGTRIPYLAVSAVVALAGMAFIVMHNPERMGRVNALFALESDEYRLSDGYQQLHGLYAFANGGINGAGLGNGVEKLGYLPEAHTDFIFPAIGEELGLWFTLGSVFCFVLIVVYGIAIAMNAKDVFGRLMAMGLTSVIVIPAMLNIGVCTAVLPNTGLPLPFISYGGTNLVFTLLAVGLLVSIHRQTNFVNRSEMPVINEKKQCVRI